MVQAQVVMHHKKPIMNNDYDRVKVTYISSYDTCVGPCISTKAEKETGKREKKRQEKGKKNTCITLCIGA